MQEQLVAYLIEYSRCCSGAAAQTQIQAHIQCAKGQAFDVRSLGDLGECFYSPGAFNQRPDSLAMSRYLLDLIAALGLWQYDGIHPRVRITEVQVCAKLRMVECVDAH
ncbi:hypothetical protein D9M71_574480 [compost metagenome]